MVWSLNGKIASWATPVKFPDGVNPVKFPAVGCTKPDCQHRHDVILTGARKLSPPDKEAVVKTLTNMPGNLGFHHPLQVVYAAR